MQNILVPTDFSDNSKNALAYAYHLARTMNAHIHLFHAYHIPYIHAEMPAGMYQTAIQEAEEEANKNMEKYANEILTKDGEETVSYSFFSKLGFAVEEVLNASEELDIDLIVMGTQGINGVADAIFGSITSSVVDKAECPVLAVPEDSKFNGITKIAFATSYDESDLEALKKLVNFAGYFDATIKLVHVNKEGENIEKPQEADFRSRISSNIDYDKLEFEVCEDDDVADGINQYVQAHGVELIALMKKKRGMFNSLFHRSITRKMAFHAQVPLLAYHE